MTKLIALSWPGNTWKTTLQKKIVEKLQSDGYKVLYFPESARVAMGDVGTSDMSEFQNMIQEIESNRSEIIQNQLSKWLFDVIICDRTRMEQNAYLLYNITKGIITEPVTIKPQQIDYDRVYYFDSPIKETTTQEFNHYNNEELNDLMRRLVKGRFGNNAKLYSNGKEDGDVVILDILAMLESQD